MNALQIIIDELERFERLATPGTWQVYTSNSFRRIGLRGTYRELISPVRSASDGHADLAGPNVDHDLDFLVALRNAWPLLVAACNAREVQIHSLNVVLSALAAKAGIETSALIELLDEAAAGIEAGAPGKPGLH